MEFLNNLLQKIFPNFTLENVIIWLKEIVIFILKPNRFKSIYYSKNYVEQTIQIIFYALLTLLAYFTFGAGHTYIESFKLIFIILIMALPFILINSISFLILKKKKFKIWRVISYILISSFIFFFPILILQYFFLDTENYTFAFISNVFLVTSVLYNLFIIHIAFSKSILKSLIGIILNTAILNVLLIILGLITFDSYSKTELSNSILKEYNLHSQKIELLNGDPVNVIVIRDMKNKYEERFVGYSIEDSIQYYDETGLNQIISKSSLSEKYLDSVIPNMDFKRNKDLFRELKKYFNGLQAYLNSVSIDQNLTEQTVYKSEENESILYIKNEYNQQREFLIHKENFISKRNQLAEMENYADSPNYIFEIITYPSEILRKILGLKEKGNVSIMFK